MSRAV